MASNHVGSGDQSPNHASRIEGEADADLLGGKMVVLPLLWKASHKKGYGKLAVMESCGEQIA